jgi:hypothetical protein
LVKYVFGYDVAGRKVLLDRVPYWPSEAHPMEMIFEETKPWPKTDLQEWALVFGPDYDGLESSDYWHTNYDDLANQGYDTATVYYNIFKHCGKPVIQYWFFYPFNDWANEHEGDWEHINVKITSPNIDRAVIDEVLYYFHYNFKVVPGDLVPLANGTTTHPIVYVGGRADVFFDGKSCSYWGDNSGGSYWRTGKFVDVGKGLGHSVDEWIDEPLHVTPWYHFTDPQHHLERLVRNDRVANHFWSDFPWGWGRHAFEIHFGAIKSEPGPSPMLHECWEVYRHPGYWEYGFDAGPIASAPPPGDGVPLTKDNTTPVPVRPEAGFRPSPDAGKYLTPDVGAVPGGELGAPGADLPPVGGPPMTAPVGFGCDSLSGEGTSADLPPAPAAAAQPLSCGPNPVSTSARITFKLEAPCAVRLAVYDLSGRRVATLAEGRYDAGEHVVEWRADVPTGVYIYRLDAAGKVATRKLVVAK